MTNKELEKLAVAVSALIPQTAFSLIVYDIDEDDESVRSHYVSNIDEQIIKDVLVDVINKLINRTKLD